MFLKLICHVPFYRKRYFKKTFLIVKLTAFFLLAVCLQVGASGYAQKITLSETNVSLKKIFKEIERQSEYHFFYKDKLLKQAEIVSVNVNNASVEEVLDQCFKEQPLTYTILEKTIVIKEKKLYTLPTPAPIEHASAPSNIIGGSVKDAQGNPLAGVSVVVRGTNRGTSTTTNGGFSIDANAGDVLEFTIVGYQKKSVTVGQSNNIAVVMEIEASIANEVVVVGYGRQKKTSVTAAVSSIDGAQLTKAPVANISNSLIGRVPGLISKQNTGEPGADMNNIKIRGIGTTGNSDPLIVVDGIPRSFNQLNPNEIESVSVLKDAAAVAPYGLAGANGVILITTKRGKTGTVSMTYDGWVGIQQPTQYPKYLDAYGYAKLLNEANENINIAPTYTAEELQKFKDGSDPSHYPNTDWVSEVLNFKAPITNHSLSFSGGSEKVRFFGSLGYLFQEGVVDVINLNRYNIAVNVDADVTATTTISLDVKGNIQKKKNPGGASGSSIFTDVTKNPPIFTYRFPNGLPGTTAYPQIYESGYDNTTDNVLYSQLSIQQELPFIPGLAVKGVFAFDKNYSFNKHWTLPITYYSLNAQDEYLPLAGGPPTPTLSQGFTEGQISTLQAYLTYKKQFGKHNLDLLGVYEQRMGDNLNFSASRIGYSVLLDELSLGSTDKANFDNSGNSGRTAQVGLVYRAAYHYDNKYLIELGGRYDGHYYFAPGKRFTFFPAISAGWLLSEERLIRDNIPWITVLKLRSSYGISGNLAGSAFQYLSSYGLGDSYVFGGSNPYQVQGVFERIEPNINITWETAKKFNLGLDASLWNRKLNFEINFFTENRTDMLVSPNASVPAEYGIGISQENAGIMKNKGAEFSISTAQKFSKDFNMNVGFNFSYAKNKLVQTFENPTTLSNPNRSRTGKPLGTQFGYRSLGLFQSEEEIQKSATQFGNLLPGDIKYEDINGDGKIDPNDEVVIGNPAFPGIIYGFNADLFWKGFDLSMLLQGAGNVDFYLADDAAFPFFNGAKVQDIHLDYWTPENRNASNPRLTPATTTNNTQQSSFWMRDASFLRLKTLELGYTLPESVVSSLRVRNVRIYTSGQNLWALSKIRNFDPEVSNSKGRFYFQQRVFSFGLNVTF